MSSVNYIYGDLNISGQLKISSGATAGYVLTSSDSSGNCTWSPVVSGGIAGLTGSGTTNYLSKFTGTNSISDSRISDDGQTVSINSKVQIGTGSVAVGTYSYAEGINTTSSSDGSHAEGHSNLAGIRKFDCYINNGLVRITNGVNYTSDFTSGVILMSDGLTYSYNVMSCTYSSPIFQFQMVNTGFMANGSYYSLATFETILPGPPFSEISLFPNNSIPINIGGQTTYIGGDRYKTGDINLNIQLNNSNNFFCDFLAISVPEGWIINSASPFIGEETWVIDGIEYSVYGPTISIYQFGLIFMGVTCSGRAVTWGHNGINGGIPNSSAGYETTYPIKLNVTIDESISGIQTLSYFASPDADGEAASLSQVTGTLDLQPEDLWVVDSSNLANIKGTPIGNGSHAEGFQTTSIGDYSHTGGIGTIAMSEGQFSIGKWNTATNSNSLFTIGNGTSSSNRSDLAIFKEDSITFNKSLILKDGTHGSGKILVSDSNGLASWTQSISGITGSGTTNYISKFTGTNSISNSRISDDGQTVSINSKVQIGTGSIAIGSYSYSEGNQNISGYKAFLANVNNGLITITNGIDYTSEFTSGDVYLISTYNNQIIYPRKSYSIYSVTFSSPTFSLQLEDTTIGGGGSTFIVDIENLNSDLATNKFGDYSHSEGQYTNALGFNSHSEGEYTSALGLNSHAEGQYTRSYGQSSHAEGASNVAIGAYSHVEGIDNTSKGNSSHAEGSNTKSIGHISHAEGQLTKSIGQSSHAEGYNTISGYVGFNVSYVINGLIRIYSDVNCSYLFTSSFVYLDNVKYQYSSINYNSPDFTIQLIDTSVNSGSLVVDIDHLYHDLSTDIFGDYTHAEGNDTKALGQNSHAEGYNTTALGNNSHVQGIGTIAISEAQFVTGKWNAATNSSDLFVIGNGSSNTNRSDLANFSNDVIKFNTNLLHQLGSFRLEDGTQGAGKILVSDSNGLASWTASVTYGSVNKYESLNVSITMGVTQSFTHSLNSTSIITQIWDNDSGEIIYGKFFNRQPNSVDLVLSNTYTSVDIIIMS